MLQVPQIVDGKATIEGFESVTFLHKIASPKREERSRSGT